MSRSARDIIEKIKEYRNSPAAMEALADMLLFMGIPEGMEFYQTAQEEIEQEKEKDTDMRQAYYRHLKKGAAHYMSYNLFKKKKEAGEI
jgi:hypothetical protein